MTTHPAILSEIDDVRAEQLRGCSLAVTVRTGVPLCFMQGPSRVPAVSRARQDLMLMLRREVQWGLQEIADVFGRDHTTVIYGLRKAAERERAAAGPGMRLPFRRARA